MIELVRGNMLDSKVEALVNTVNTEGVAGKGIALQFKRAFPANYEAYHRACKSGRLTTGTVLTVAVGGITLPRYIINFPTKRTWRAPSKIEYVQSGLAALRAEVERLRIRSIAIPPLGCGNGGLDWRRVRPLIEATFADLRDCQALLYGPDGAPEPEAMRDARPRPRMTPGRAAVIALMHRYLDPGLDYLLSLLEVQKLAYFLQAAGEPLRLKYVKHTYGPYAENLRHVLERLEGHFITGFGDGKSGPTTPLSLLPQAFESASGCLEEDVGAHDRLDRVARVIEGYETPFGMELLSSVHWVAQNGTGDERLDPRAAIESIHAWNERKASLFKPNQIRSAWTRLEEHGWL